MRHRAMLGSMAVFSASVLVFAYIYYVLSSTIAMVALLRLTAGLSALLLNALGLGVSISGITLSSGSFSVDVGASCSALVPVMLFTAAAIAFPSTWKQKAAGIITGSAFLLALNQVRIVSLFYIGTRNYALFETAHLLVWQSVMVLSAVAAWLVWVQVVRKGRVA